MRYTTIIDLRDFPELYRNVNIRLVFLHMSLVAGYHTEDRDLYAGSLRQLESDTGCTLSAVRHALAQLEGRKLIQRTQRGWLVKKFFVQEPLPTRPKKGVKTESDRLYNQELTLDEHRQISDMRYTNFMYIYEGIAREAKKGETKYVPWLKKNYVQYEAEWRARAAKLEKEKKE